MIAQGFQKKSMQNFTCFAQGDWISAKTQENCDEYHQKLKYFSAKGKSTSLALSKLCGREKPES